MPQSTTSTREVVARSIACEQCPFCRAALSDEWVKAAHSRVAGRAGGRPRVLRRCPFCREKFGARALREHAPVCEENPKLKSAER